MSILAPNRLTVLKDDSTLESRAMLAASDFTSGALDGINVSRVDRTTSTLKTPDVLLRNRGWTNDRINSATDIEKTQELAAFLNEQGINSVRLGFDLNEAATKSGNFNTLVDQIQTLSDSGVTSLVNVWTGVDENRFDSRSIDAWQNVVDSVGGISGVAGYELINEPDYGSQKTYTNELLDVYKGVNGWGDQAVLVNGLGFSTKFGDNLVNRVNRNIPNAVFAPHTYPYLHGGGKRSPTSVDDFTQEERNRSASQWKDHYIDRFKANFDKLNGNFAVTEFGAPEKISEKINGSTSALDKIQYRRARGHNQAVEEYFGNNSSYFFNLGPSKNDYIRNSGNVNEANNAAIKEVFDGSA